MERLADGQSIKCTHWDHTVKSAVVIHDYGYHAGILAHVAGVGEAWLAVKIGIYYVQY